MRILIVDDNEDICKLICRILEPYGECKHVLTGRSAIDTIVEHWENGKPFQGVFMDIMMPGMDGIETLSEIRAMEKKGLNRGSDAIKIIMVTASNNPKHVINSFKEQSDGYITKPFDEEKILNELRKLEMI